MSLSDYRKTISENIKINFDLDGLEEKIFNYVSTLYPEFEATENGSSPPANNDFATKYLSIAYNIIGELRSGGINTTLNDLETLVTGEVRYGPKQLTSVTKDDLAFMRAPFNRSYYDKYISKSDGLISDSLSSVEIEEGIFKCFKCGCNKCTYYSIQKRSCDEPPTTYVRCTNKKCNNRWRFG